MRTPKRPKDVPDSYRFRWVPLELYVPVWYAVDLAPWSVAEMVQREFEGLGYEGCRVRAHFPSLFEAIAAEEGEECDFPITTD
ncbi:hypothetical protein [Olsenella phocaeensis]|uniref:hypothetical protein n=1 Tax=Olsenella phocaeensis TaxID=1852385 RepID=UPI0009303742|nr:hypothetical protein [Olsenella phocaeensis]